MLIKIAIFTVIGLLASLVMVLGRRRWLAWQDPAAKRDRYLKRLNKRLNSAHEEQERCLTLQKNINRPDAEEFFLLNGFTRWSGSATDGGEWVTVRHPTLGQVRHYLENRAQDDIRDLLKGIAEDIQELNVRIENVDRPKDTEQAIEKRQARVRRLELELEHEQAELAKLHMQRLPPDPYGRLPKPREEPRAAEVEPEPELAEATEPRKIRA
jgi:hypothetical protein